MTLPHQSLDKIAPDRDGDTPSVAADSGEMPSKPDVPDAPTEPEAPAPTKVSGTSIQRSLDIIDTKLLKLNGRFQKLWEDRANPTVLQSIYSVRKSVDDLARKPEPKDRSLYVFVSLALLALGGFVLLIVGSSSLSAAKANAIEAEKLSQQIAALESRSADQKDAADRIDATLKGLAARPLPSTKSSPTVAEIVAAIPKAGSTSIGLTDNQIQLIASKVRENLPVGKGEFDEARLKPLIAAALADMKLAKADDIAKIVAAMPKSPETLTAKAIAEAVKASIEPSLRGIGGAPNATGGKTIDLFVVVTRSDKMPSDEYSKAFLGVLQKYSAQRVKDSPVRLGLYFAPQKLAAMVAIDQEALPENLKNRLEQPALSNDIEDLGRTGKELRAILDDRRPARHAVIVASVEAKAPEADAVGWKEFSSVDVVLVQPTSAAGVGNTNAWLTFVGARKGRLTLIAPAATGPPRESIDPSLFQALIQSLESARR